MRHILHASIKRGEYISLTVHEGRIRALRSATAQRHRRRRRRLHSIMLGYYDECNAVSAILCANTFPALWRRDLKTAPWYPPPRGLATVQRRRPRVCRLRKILNSPSGVAWTLICLQYATRIGIILENSWHVFRRASFPVWFKNSVYMLSFPKEKKTEIYILGKYYLRTMNRQKNISTKTANIWKANFPYTIYHL